VADRLGPYRLLRVLGKGAFGVVYEAQREGHERRVALKVLRDSETLGNDELRRFRLEGKIAQRLDAAGLVSVYEMDQAEGQVYIAMELVEGETLKERLKHGPLPVPEAARIVHQLALCMSEVHAAGVLHRDLKPANVLLDRGGRPRISDFGLAKDRSLARSLTQTGELIGTPAYMAPEQARGRRDLDHRVDVYALGAIFYECLTGRRVHTGHTIHQLVHQIAHEEVPPPSQLMPGIPAACDAICARALAKDRGDRHMNCEALALDLEALLAPERAERSGLARPLALGVGALLLAGLTGYGVSLSLSAGPPTSSPGPAPSLSASPEPSHTPLDLEDDLRQQLDRAAAASSLAELEQRISAACAQALEAGRHEWVERAKLVQARTLVTKGHYREATAYLDREQGSLSGEARERAGLLRVYAIMGQRSGWSQTVVELDRLAKQTSAGSLVGLTARSWLHLNLASRWRSRNREEREQHLESAERFAREACRTDPDFLSACLALASVLTRREAAEAEAHWKRAYELGPQDSRVPWAEANAFRRGAEAREERARDRYLELTRGARSYVRARYLLSRGWERVRQGLAGAEEDLREVAEERPFELRAHLGLSVLAMRAGEPERAKREFALAAALGPERGRRALTITERIRQDLRPDDAARLLQLASKALDATSWLEPLPKEHGRALAEALTLTVTGANYEEVRAELAGSVREPDDLQATLLRADIAVGRDLYDLAQQFIAQAVELGAPAPRVALLQADLAARRGQRVEALRRYRDLAQGEGVEAQCAKAELALIEGDLRTTAKVAAALRVSRPDLGRGHILFSLASAAADPVAALMSAASARARQGDLDVRALIAQHLAHMMCLNLGLRAWVPSEQVSLIPSLSPSAHARVVVAQTVLQVFQIERRPDILRQAETILARGIELEPTYPDLYLLEGRIRMLSGGKPSEVLESWGRFHELDSGRSLPRPDRALFGKLFPAELPQLEQLFPAGG